MKHDLINTGDPDSFKDIEDGHGCVVLAYCRACKEGESGLAAECPGAKKTGAEKEMDKVKPAARKSHPKITMGQVAAILGVSPSMKRSTVLRDMVRAYHGAPSEYVANIAAEYNDDYRATAEEAFVNRFDMQLEKVDVKKPHKILSSHPTYVDSAKRGSKGLLFIRTPHGQRSALNPEDFKSLDDQPHMFAQMQVEMHLAGVTWGIFFQWSALSSAYVMVEIDHKWLDTNLPQLEAFYAIYKEETKNKIHLEPLRKTIDNASVRKLLDEFDDLSVAIGNATTRKGEIMAELKKAAKDTSAILGAGRLLTKTEKKGSVSYSDMVRKLLPNEDVEPYRGNPSESWTLT